MNASAHVGRRRVSLARGRMSDTSPLVKYFLLRQRLERNPLSLRHCLCGVQRKARCEKDYEREHARGCQRRPDILDDKKRQPGAARRTATVNESVERPTDAPVETMPDKLTYMGWYALTLQPVVRAARSAVVIDRNHIILAAPPIEKSCESPRPVPRTIFRTRRRIRAIGKGGSAFRLPANAGRRLSGPCRLLQASS